MRASSYGAVLAAAAKCEAQRRLGRPVVPYKLEFILTFSCQSRCKTCNIWSRYIEAPERQADELSADEVIRAATSAREHARWISLTGGEITDRPDLVEIVGGIMAGAGEGLAMMNFTTNGIHPERVEEVFPKILAQTGALPVFVSVSLDGLGETYEEVRGVPEGYERVRSSMATLRRLQAAYPSLSVSHQLTISRFNLDQAEAIFEAALAAGDPPTVTLATDAFQLTRGKQGVDLRPRADEVAPLVQRLAKRFSLTAPSSLPPRAYLGSVERYLETGEAPLPCVAGYATLTIDPYGKALQCDSHDLTLGDLREHDLDIVALARSEGYQEALKQGANCRACWTPCQAYPTLMHHPVSSTLQVMKTLR